MKKTESMAKDTKWYTERLRLFPTEVKRSFFSETADFIENLAAELEAMKRQRDALLKTIDVEYIARLEEKAMRCDALEEMIKRGLCKENGGTEE